MPNPARDREAAALFPALCAVIALVLLSSMPIYRGIESSFSDSRGLGAAMLQLRTDLEENAAVAVFLGLDATPDEPVPVEDPFDLEAAVAAYIEAHTPAFVLPLDGHITSPFGPRQDPFAPSGLLPLAADTETHGGIDIASADTDQIRAALDGTVRFVGWDDSYGSYLILTHADCETLYAHCSRITVTPGQTVRAGEPIAITGDTGRATGIHLHFEVHRAGQRVDPMAYFGLDTGRAPA